MLNYFIAIIALTLIIVLSFKYIPVLFAIPIILIAIFIATLVTIFHLDIKPEG